MMKLSLFAPLLSLGLAQHLELDIPSVDAAVNHALKDYPEFVNPNKGAKSNSTRITISQLDTASCDFWMDDLTHQGLAAFNSDPGSYQVYRNVKDFGAKGDGATDDTAAINSAISSGNRCAPGSCASSTTSPAVVYFPAGTYMVSNSILDYYYTQLIGNPNCMPIIQATAGFSGSLGVIDGDQYQNSGNLAYGATNVFWRQIRNLVIDTTLLPASSAVTGIHWPVGQATSLENVVFEMSSESGTQHRGIFIESGSGGFLGDLVFNGGQYGMTVGNQQFTSRNLTFNNNIVGINQIWDWGWTYQGISFNGNSIGLLMNASAPSALAVGSMTLLDSTFTNCDVAVQAGREDGSAPANANALILENVSLNNVPVAVQNYDGTSLTGTTSTTTIAAWGQGSSYTPSGPNQFQTTIPIAGNGRPDSLLSGTEYYTRAKPQYETYPSSQFLSVRSQGAKGDGTTDDTAALQSAINTAVSAGQVLFLDHGDYLVTTTIYIPSGSKIVGESYPVILSSGDFFNDMSNPQPVVQIGKSGEAGSIEWTDTIVSGRGQQQGAIFFQYNLVSPSATPSGLWDVHARVGGFAGSDLQVGNCPTTPDTTVTSSNLVQTCIAGFLTMHITPGSTGLYLENVWLWVADHDADDASNTQVTIYAGRGLLDESQGPVWMVGTAVEHHSLYQYEFSGASNVYAGQIQTETPYYQPNPDATIPFAADSSYSDPVFTSGTITVANGTVSTATAWGLRISASTDILIYGAGHYSFFNDYSTACSDQDAGSYCQESIIDIEGTTSDVTIYNINTVGVQKAITIDGTSAALYSDDVAGYTANIAWFTTNTS